MSIKCQRCNERHPTTYTRCACQRDPKTQSEIIIELHAEIELLKSQAGYHFETQREDYNRLEDLLVANEGLKAEIERLNAEISRLSLSAFRVDEEQTAEIERLNARLGVIQNAADHCIIDVCPVRTPAVYDALWGGDK